MKKFLLLLVSAFTLQLAVAQDLKKVQTAYLINRFEDAKVEIDKVMADPKQKDKPEAFYWKAKIAAMYFKDAKLRDKSPNTLKDADDAFQKYMQADQAFVQVKEKGAEAFFDMYATGYELGIKQFNDKKWDDATTYFKITVDYGDIIFKNKWSNKPVVLDTIPILYLAYAYQNANKPEEATKYYSRLADAKVSGENYLDIYRFLASHYTTTKNLPQFTKYVTLGRELYPKFPWDELEIEYMDENLTLAEKTALYDKENAAGTLTEIKYLQFGDIFVNAPHKEKNMDSISKKMYDLKAAEAYQKAFAKNGENGVAAYNVGVIYYNIYGEYDDLYAANIRTMQTLNADRPVEKDPKKKAAADALYKTKTDPIKKANAELEKPLMENLNMSLEWLEKAYNILKAKPTRTSTEKNVINKSVDFLANLYGYKRDKVRGKDDKAYDAFEAKYKEYDGLHAKY